MSILQDGNAPRLYAWRQYQPAWPDILYSRFALPDSVWPAKQAGAQPFQHHAFEPKSHKQLRKMFALHGQRIAISARRRLQHANFYLPAAAALQRYHFALANVVRKPVASSGLAEVICFTTRKAASARWSDALGAITQQRGAAPGRIEAMLDQPYAGLYPSSPAAGSDAANEIRARAAA